MKYLGAYVNLVPVRPNEFRVLYRPRLVRQKPLSPDWICPKCQVKMESRQLKGIMLERCPSCSGIFLDDGELEELLGIRSEA